MDFTIGELIILQKSLDALKTIGAKIDLWEPEELQELTIIQLKLGIAILKAREVE